mmetsp:Transcript_25967/g.60622  ORF Transcript_25967/g.60622 Transcript_25967/m.60622 type:complete len:208 (-) Transcript_25967:426-1049(-)
MVLGAAHITHAPNRTNHADPRAGTPRSLQRGEDLEPVADRDDADFLECLIERLLAVAAHTLDQQWQLERLPLKRFLVLLQPERGEELADAGRRAGRRRRERVELLGRDGLLHRLLDLLHKHPALFLLRPLYSDALSNHPLHLQLESLVLLHGRSCALYVLWSPNWRRPGERIRLPRGLRFRPLPPRRQLGERVVLFVEQPSIFGWRR